MLDLTACHLTDSPTDILDADDADAAVLDTPVDPLADLTPAELVARIRTGDAAARSELLDRFGGLIHLVAVEYAPDPAQVEDLEQECRIHLLRQLPRYDATRPLKPWLMTVVRNCARNFRRSASRWRLVSLPETLQPFETDVPSLSQALADREVHDRLRRAVSQLPEIYRSVVERRYYSEEPCESIATALAIPVGTVKNRLFRARQMLADRLEAAAGN